METIYPLSTSEIAHKRRDLTPDQQGAFDAFGKAVFADGALSAKAKQISRLRWPTRHSAPTASMVRPRRHCAQERRRKN
jgi:hypothetical protein